MVVGDVVNGLGAVGGTLTLQPAAGVEILINSVSGHTTWFLFDNGVLDSLIGYIAGITRNKSTVRLFINNSIYLRIDPIALYSNGYSGIQIK